MFRWLFFQIALLASFLSPHPKVVVPIIVTEPMVALTFDADMTQGMYDNLKNGKVKSWYNKDVIDILEKNKVPATLFITGLWAKAYPEITKELSENPLFEIGNHSYSHLGFTSGCYTLPKVGNKEKEIGDDQEIIKNITGSAPTLFRFPGGCYSKNDLELVKKFGLKVVGWDVVSGDAFNENTQSIVARVEKKTKPGSIIVMHLNGGKNAPATAKALPEIISFLKAKGYTFVKVSELDR